MAYIFILIAVLLRIAPHAPNFAPIGAMALFAGAKLDKKYSLILPIVAMFISDLFLGFHQTMFWVYGSFVLIGLLGIWLKKHEKLSTIALSSLAGSVIFFLVTNFGVWLAWYPHNLNGIISCFTLAIPFFRNTLAGDLFYTAIFFGGYALARHLVDSVKKTKTA